MIFLKIYLPLSIYLSVKEDVTLKIMPSNMISLISFFLSISIYRSIYLSTIYIISSCFKRLNFSYPSHITIMYWITNIKLNIKQFFHCNDSKRNEIFPPATSSRLHYNSNILTILQRSQYKVNFSCFLLSFIPFLFYSKQPQSSKISSSPTSHRHSLCLRTHNPEEVMQDEAANGNSNI